MKFYPRDMREPVDISNEDLLTILQEFAYEELGYVLSDFAKSLRNNAYHEQRNSPAPETETLAGDYREAADAMEQASNMMFHLHILLDK